MAVIGGLGTWVTMKCQQLAKERYKINGLQKMKMMPKRYQNVGEVYKNCFFFISSLQNNVKFTKTIKYSNVAIQQNIDFKLRLLRNYMFCWYRDLYTIRKSDLRDSKWFQFYQKCSGIDIRFYTWKYQNWKVKCDDSVRLCYGKSYTTHLVFWNNLTSKSTYILVILQCL